MIVFFIKKVKITFDFSFFAVLALLFILCNGQYFKYGVIICIIHELGHLIPITLFGGEIAEIKFHGAGIKIVPKKNKIKPIWQENIIMLGGCGVNLITGLLCLIFGSTQNIQLFAYMNIILGFFNLLPYKNFDGGTLLSSIIMYYSKKCDFYNVAKTMKYINTIISVILIFCVVTFGNANITLLVTIVYLMILEILF